MHSAVASLHAIVASPQAVVASFYARVASPHADVASPYSIVASLLDVLDTLHGDVMVRISRQIFEDIYYEKVNHPLKGGNNLSKIQIPSSGVRPFQTKLTNIINN